MPENAAADTALPSIPPSAFISHAHEDKWFVRRLVESLKEEGISAWTDESGMVVGDDIVEKIANQLGQTKHFIVVLSKASAASRWVQKELATALMNNLGDEQAARILPVVIGDCEKRDIPPLLRSTVYADFRTDYDTGLAKLVSSIKDSPRPVSLGDDPTDRFLAMIISIFGAVALFWQIRALGAESNYQVIWMPGWGQSYPSQVILCTLFLLGIALVVLHVAAHAHQKFSSPRNLGRWFPGRLFALSIPPRLKWVRILAFMFLIAAPTVIQAYWVGRMFHRMEIVWKGREDAVKLRRAGLLTFPKTPDGSPGGIFSGDWRWSYWKDEEAAKRGFGKKEDQMTLKEKEFARDLVRDSVFPAAGIQPWLFLIEGVALSVSLLVLLWRALFAPRTPAMLPPPSS